jgi:hypothetical protein
VPQPASAETPLPKAYHKGLGWPCLWPPMPLAKGSRVSASVLVLSVLPRPTLLSKAFAPASPRVVGKIRQVATRLLGACFVTVSYAFLPLRLLRPRYVTSYGSWGSSVTYGYGEIYSRNVRNALSTLIRLDFELIGHEPASTVFVDQVALPESIAQIE